MKDKTKIVYDKYCDVCEEQKSELVEIKRQQIFWTVKTNVCQGCISGIFRSFRKDR